MALVKCPQCGKEVEFAGNDFRPFCSERCRLLDLGAWADGEYALPAQTTELSEEDRIRIEQAKEERDDSNAP
ncbi:MAG: DNA gyrase inhibitor YacG [Chloracidobacterium sp.]|nr:DNA gyrase inhibitor YacG [Chloracidobacterium sp.]MCC6825762.1 DNA gyrase inhibitor YacG [Acidobacteriota bacterium]MCO5332916.1 DNA gyrase inhibitor YacG [Pyrinomonadaceae bacterium]